MGRRPILKGMGVAHSVTKVRAPGPYRILHYVIFFCVLRTQQKKILNK